MASLISSRKARGRNLQKWVVSQLRAALDRLPKSEFPYCEITNYDDLKNDILSRSMGAQGTDIIISNTVREYGNMNYDIECKNQESISLWAAWEQCNNNKGIGEPVLVIKRNKSKPLVVVDAEWFFKVGRN